MKFVSNTCVTWYQKCYKICEQKGSSFFEDLTAPPLQGPIQKDNFQRKFYAKLVLSALIGSSKLINQSER